MLCAISRGNWNNGVNAGVRARNLSNARAHATTDVGVAADSMPITPHAACAVRQRGSLCRALRRNVESAGLLVAVPAHVGRAAKTGRRASLLGPSS